MERSEQEECSSTRLFLHLRLVYKTTFSVGHSFTVVSGINHNTVFSSVQR